MKPIIIDVDSQNIEKYPATCFMNPNDQGYKTKKEWLLKRFSEGLKIKLLYVENDKKCHGFIEYVPGEYAWRAVKAKGYLFIHCIWVSPNIFKKKGNGSLLVQAVIEDAKKQGKYGVAVVTSEGSFMAGKDLFIKNGFQSVAKAQPSFELLMKPLKKGPLPEFNNWEKQLNSLKGLNIVYSNQCPWVARFIREVGGKKKDLNITEQKTAKDAQNAPSPYSVFNLVYNGKMLADHYISMTRFQNILKKEVGIFRRGT